MAEKVRKPRPFKIGGKVLVWPEVGYKRRVVLWGRKPHNENVTADQCRRAAKFFTQAAAWIEQQENNDGK